MRRSTWKWITLFTALVSGLFANTANEGYAEPDRVMFKDGTVRRGIIVRNTAQTLCLQERYAINEYPKSSIVRIYDQADIGMEFTESPEKGDLPSWRVMVNDIRNNDAIKSLVEIPATAIDNGKLKNVPYRSFRINELIEMNIYGDPEDPAAIEFGIYGSKRNDERLRRMIRSFICGFLRSRAEVAALYSIPFSGGIRELGYFTMEITPPDGPDAYGAWWITLYNRQSLDKARLDDAEYARLVRPPSEVVDSSGRAKKGVWNIKDLLKFPGPHGGDNGSVFLRGFYRDASGHFKIPSE